MCSTNCLSVGHGGGFSRNDNHGQITARVVTRVVTFEPIIEQLQTISVVARKCAIGLIAEIAPRCAGTTGAAATPPSV